LSANVPIKLKRQLNELNGTNQIWNQLNQAQQKKKVQSDRVSIKPTRVVSYPQKRQKKERQEGRN